jgi:pyrroloquinoline quinone (PQQ) biosynthesis protein C
LNLSREIPMIENPWFQGIVNGVFERNQIIKGELQHYLRVRHNAEIFGSIVSNAIREEDEGSLWVALENYKDEVMGDISHKDLMFQFLDSLDFSREYAESVESTAGTAAAIAMLLHGTKNMSALEGIAITSLPEYQNGGSEGVAAQIYGSLIKNYGFSEHAAETFKVHSLADVDHGGRQIDFLVERVEQNPEQAEKILRAARYGVNAFNFEWDGHYQAATEKSHFHWKGSNNDSD